MWFTVESVTGGPMRRCTTRSAADSWCAKASHQSRTPRIPWRFTTGDEMLKLCDERHASTREIVWGNECAVRSESDVRGGPRGLDGDGRLIDATFYAEGCCRAGLRCAAGAGVARQLMLRDGGDAHADRWTG